MRGRLAKAALALMALILLVDAYQSDRRMFRQPAARLQAARDAVGRALQEQHGLAVYLRAQAAPLVDWVSGAPVQVYGTETMAGPDGLRLRFDGRRRTFASLPVRWSDLPDSFTLAVRLRLDERSGDQDILFAQDGPVGLKLDRGRLTFFVPGTNGPAGVAYDFQRYGDLVQVVAVVDASRAQIHLYEEGILRASGTFTPFSRPGTAMEIGRSASPMVREPLAGDLASVQVWKRACTEDEVRRWSVPGALDLPHLVPRAYHRYTRAVAGQQFLRRALKLADLFKPAVHPGWWRQDELPEVNLVLSKKDAKHFMRSHAASRLSGRRPDAAANPRRIHVMAEASAHVAHLRLHGSNTDYPAISRPAYVVEMEPGGALLGLQRLHLVPPESAGWLELLFEREVALRLGLPAPVAGMCRLRINGDWVGNYLYEDYSTCGVQPGYRMANFSGRPLPQAWTRLGLTEPPPLRPAERQAAYQKVVDTYQDWMVRDMTSPLSSREVAYRIQQDRARVEAWPLSEPSTISGLVARAACLRTPFALLGSNPSPAYVQYDLALPSTLGPEQAVTWSSSRPDVLSGQGRVVRPAGDQPVEVILTAQAAGSWSTQWVFRIMPEIKKLPAIFLWSGEALSRGVRAEGAVDYFPAGTGDPEPKRWMASQYRQAGLSLRGNTSLLEPKKPFAVRLSEPHGLWPDAIRSTEINLVNPYRDPTFLHNRLCYDWFQQMSGSTHGRVGLPVTWAEVFLNGNYYGLFEASPAPDAAWMNLSESESGGAPGYVVYKKQRSPPTLAEPLAMRQIEPSRREGHFPEPSLALHRFLDNASPDELVRDLARWMDMDNLVDYHLLLNLSENLNGPPHLYTMHDILVRPAGPDERFYLVAWDFDATFHPRRTPMAWYNNRLFARLMKADPSYRAHLGRRWRELRAGMLADAEVERTVRAHEKILAGYVEQNYARWGQSAGRTHAQRVDELLAQIQLRSRELDGMLARYP